jgi:hypothetical protein
VPEALAVAAPPSVTRDRVSAILYPIATFSLLLLTWQFLVRKFGVPEYILPVPTEFLAKLYESRGLRRFEPQGRQRRRRRQPGGPDPRDAAGRIVDLKVMVRPPADPLSSS